MHKRSRIISVSFITISLLFVCTAFNDIRKSAGSPVGNTGAPGELICTQCHNTYNLDNGPGSLAISSEDNITRYTSGKTYLLTVEVTEAGIEKFGFQSSAFTSDTLRAGRFSLEEPFRTQVIIPQDQSNPYYGREYVTHTLEGNTASNSGNSTWTFKWTAPDSNAGPVTFYVAAVAANNNETEFGDYVYADTLQLKFDPASGVINNSTSSVRIYPNPFDQKLLIDPSSKNKVYNFKLYNLKGEKIIQKNISGSLRLDFENDMAAGVYFYKISSEQDLIKSGRLIKN